MSTTQDASVPEVQEHEVQQPGALQTLVAVYNRYLVDLLLQHKGRATLRQRLRDAGHKAIDPASADHIAHAAAALGTDGLRAALADAIEPEAVLTDARSLAFEPLSGVPVSAAVAAVDSEQPLSAEDARGLGAYVFIFATLAAAYSEGCEVLARHVVDALAKAQSGLAGADESIDNILEDDIVLLLDKVARISERTPSAPAAAEAEAEAEAAGVAGASDDIGRLDDVMKLLEHSKIAGMASEISKEINLGADTDPADLISFDKLTDGNSALGKIVSKVGATIKGKLDSGELKQEELLSEALGFLKAFEGIAGSLGKGEGGGAGGADGGASLLGEVMKMAGSMGGLGGKGGGMGGLGALSGLLGGALGGGAGGSGSSGGRMSASERREKLRRKLQQKNQAQDGAV